MESSLREVVMSQMLDVKSSLLGSETDKELTFLLKEVLEILWLL